MNGVIEYDQKLTSLPKFLLIRQHSPKKSYWNTIFIFTLIYFIAYTILLIYLWPPKEIDVHLINEFLIRIDFITDLAIIFLTYFLLQQLEYRFQMLNDSWEYLLPEFLAVSDDLSQFITRMTLDNIRLLHAELSDLLRIFSIGYGKILLVFFIFCYINMVVCFFFGIRHNYFDNNITNNEFNFKTFAIKNLPFIVNVQHIIILLSVIIAASRVHDKVYIKHRYLNNCIIQGSEIYGSQGTCDSFDLKLQLSSYKRKN